MACKNTLCKYQDSALPNGCKLFPGASWTTCRSASVKLVTANHPKTKTQKEKAR